MCSYTRVDRIRNEIIREIVTVSKKYLAVRDH